MANARVTQVIREPLVDADSAGRVTQIVREPLVRKASKARLTQITRIVIVDPTIQETDPVTTLTSTTLVMTGTGSLNTEVVASFEKTFDYHEDSSSVAFQRTFEKALYRCFIYYEALGAATWEVTVTTRRDLTTTQTLTLPALADGSVQVAIFDLVVTDDVQKLHFDLICGPASIIMVLCDLEPKGQLRKGT